MRGFTLPAAISLLLHGAHRVGHGKSGGLLHHRRMLTYLERRCLNAALALVSPLRSPLSWTPVADRSAYSSLWPARVGLPVVWPRSPWGLSQPGVLHPRAG